MKIRLTVFLVIVLMAAVSALTKCTPTQRIDSPEIVLPEGVPVPTGFTFDHDMPARTEPDPAVRYYDYTFTALTKDTPEQVRADYEGLLKAAGWELIRSNEVKKREQYRSEWTRRLPNDKKDRMEVQMTAHPHESGYKIHLRFRINT